MSCASGVCGGQSAADVNDAHLVQAFKDAIESHNKSANDSLQFVRVVSATKQVVSGFMLRGVVEVSVGGANKEYNIDVWVKPGTQGIEVQKCEPKA